MLVDKMSAEAAAALDGKTTSLLFQDSRTTLLSEIRAMAEQVISVQRLWCTAAAAAHRLVVPIVDVEAVAVAPE
jgi:hypothetical protein